MKCFFLFLCHRCRYNRGFAGTFARVLFSGLTVYQIERSVDRYLALVSLALFSACIGESRFANAQQTFVIEPDDYADETVLNDIHPQVDLRIFDGFLYTNFPEQFGVQPKPSIITVTAITNEDILGGHFTSTGTKTFAHANIGFHSESRQLAMQFSDPTSTVTIDIIGDSDLSSTVGVLEIFNVSGALLDSVSSIQLGSQDVATLSLSRAASDIGYARAYSSPDFSPFGKLDHLRFTSLTQQSLAGDFDGNGTVDAADFTVWRDGLGSAYESSDYQLWRDNFGNSSAAAVHGESIPEPAGLLLLLIGLSAGAGKRLRSYSHLPGSALSEHPPA